MHQVHGKVYGGQDRTLYTTNRYEAKTGGLPDFVDTKMLLRADAPDAMWLPVYPVRRLAARHARQLAQHLAGLRQFW